MRNDAAGLERTLASLEEQRHGCIEWVIVDGASTDGTQTRVAQLVERGAAIGISESDSGIYDAMNKGIRMASGSHTLFLNAGDELASPFAVSDIARMIEESPDDSSHTLYYGNWLVRFRDGSTLFRRARGREYTRYSMPASHQSMFFPTTFLKANLYDTSYVVCGDFNLVARAYKAGLRFASVNATVCVFEAGGFSSRRTRVQLSEALRVQAEILHVPYWFLTYSALRRLLSVYGMRVLTAIKAD